MTDGRGAQKPHVSIIRNVSQQSNETVVNEQTEAMYIHIHGRICMYMYTIIYIYIYAYTHTNMYACKYFPIYIIIYSLRSRNLSSIWQFSFPHRSISFFLRPLPRGTLAPGAALAHCHQSSIADTGKCSEETILLVNLNNGGQGVEKETKVQEFLCTKLVALVKLLVNL